MRHSVTLTTLVAMPMKCGLQSADLSHSGHGVRLCLSVCQCPTMTAELAHAPCSELRGYFCPRGTPGPLREGSSGWHSATSHPVSLMPSEDP